MARSEQERRRRMAANAGDRASASLVQRLNALIYQAVTGAMAGLAVDAAGRILFNVRNINQAERVGFAVQSIYARSAPGFARTVARGLLRLFRINTAYFREAETPIELTESLENRIVKMIMKAYGYDMDTGSVISGGYLDGNLRSPGHALAISRRIADAVAGRMPLKDFQRTFRAEFNRPGSALNAEHHYNRFARDLYHEFDRMVQGEYARQLGLTHAVYSGTVKDNTRGFCERRVNNVYTEAEILSWNSQEWRGKKPGDVRINLGGYNCRHTLSWVSEETALAIARRRGKEINSFN